MKKNVVLLDRDWWRKEREGVSEAIQFAKPLKGYGVGTKWLSCKEAAKELGVSVWTLYSYIKAKELEAIPKKKGYQIPYQAIQNFRDNLMAKKRIV